MVTERCRIVVVVPFSNYLIASHIRSTSIPVIPRSNNYVKYPTKRPPLVLITPSRCLCSHQRKERGINSKAQKDQKEMEPETSTHVRRPILQARRDIRCHLRPFAYSKRAKVILGQRMLLLGRGEWRFTSHTRRSPSP